MFRKLHIRIKIFIKEYQFSNVYLFEIKKYYRVLTISRALLLLAFGKFSFHFRLIRICKYKVYKKTFFVPTLLQGPTLILGSPEHMT